MAYEEFLPEELILRDRLAVDRTRLAAERTVLAYIRTGFAFIVGGITVLGLSNSSVHLFAGGFGIAAGLTFLVIGIFRSIKFQQKLTPLQGQLK
jgi:putative membrane protein